MGASKCCKPMYSERLLYKPHARKLQLCGTKELLKVQQHRPPHAACEMPATDVLTVAWTTTGK